MFYKECSRDTVPILKIIKVIRQKDMTRKICEDRCENHLQCQLFKFKVKNN